MSWTPSTLWHSLIGKFMGLTQGPPGSCRPQMGPMVAPWTLLSGTVRINFSFKWIIILVLSCLPISTHHHYSLGSPLSVWCYIGYKTSFGTRSRVLVSKAWQVLYNTVMHMWCELIKPINITLVVVLIIRFMGPTWGPSGAGRTQVGSMLVPWTLLSATGLVSNAYYMGLKTNALQ